MEQLLEDYMIACQYDNFEQINTIQIANGVVYWQYKDLNLDRWRENQLCLDTLLGWMYNKLLSGNK